MIKDDALVTPPPEQGLDSIRAALLDSDINARDRFGTTALHLAVNYGQLDVVKLLLEAGAKVEERNYMGSDALHATTALKGTNKRPIVDLLLEHGADINSVDIYGQTAVHLEARWGDSQSLAYLIEKGANVDARDQFGATALHYAVFAEHLEQVQLLLQAGADGQAVDNEGKNVLDWANAKTHIINVIEDHRLSQTIKEKGSLSEIEQSLQRGGRANTVDNEGNPLLHLALYHPKALEVVTLLLHFGANIERQNNEGLTPLHRTVLLGNIELTNLLLTKGAKINSFTPTGHTPLQLAQEQMNEAMVLFLQQHGGRSNEPVEERQEVVAEKTVEFDKNEGGRSILHSAIEERHSNLIALLKSYGAE